jgi:type I restriction enzyme, S subunit
MAIEFYRDGPWELPDGWVWVALRHLVSLRGEKAPPDQASTFPFVGMDDVAPNSLRIGSMGEFRSMKSAGNKFYPNDILYGRLRPYLNKVVVADLEGVASGEFIVMRAPAAIEPKYLQLFMHSRRFVNLATRDTSGDRPRIDFEKFADIEVPLAPAAEQRRIVARIDELFTEIADGEAVLTRARDDLDTWRRSLLKAAVAGELTQQWRENSNPTETGQEIIARWRREAALVRGELDFSVKPNSRDLPETWAWSNVGEAGEIRLGRQRAPQHHTGTHMRPYLRVANVFEDRLDLTDVKWMNFTPQEFKIYRLEPGDVLLNEGQSPDLLGRPSIFKGEIDGCCFQNTLLRFRAKVGLSSEFSLLVFRHYLRSGRFRREARITTNLAHLSQTRCAAIEFPIPPTAEQIEIAQKVRLLEEQAFEQFEHIETSAIGPLRQSVLKAAFEGQLVQQDLGDEPADRLLARLSEQSDQIVHRRRRRQNERVTLAAE